MIEKNSPIKKSVPGRRDPTCFELQHAILLPKGTILRQHEGKPGSFSAPTAGGAFVIEGDKAGENPDTFKRVIA